MKSFVMTWVSSKNVNYDFDLADSNSPSIQKNYPFKFRLYDGDQNLYFEGYSNDSDSEDAFKPLDHFAESYGVTTIKYFENGEWVEL